jgi:hypothetical protein
MGTGERFFAANGRRGLQAVHFGHINIHQDEINGFRDVSNQEIYALDWRLP